jgi:hypothetical protein
MFDNYSYNKVLYFVCKACSFMLILIPLIILLNIFHNKMKFNVIFKVEAAIMYISIYI